MTSQKNFQDLQKDAKSMIPKEPTRNFLFTQINYQIIRNQPTFTYAQNFYHKKNILTVYDSPSAKI